MLRASLPPFPSFLAQAASSLFSRAHREAVRRAVLLEVIIGRLTTWTAPGLLLLGVERARLRGEDGGEGGIVALLALLDARQ